MGERSYSGVTREHVNKIRKEIGKFGITIPEGDDVDVKGPLGVRMHLNYDEPAKTLNLSLVDKPAFIPESQIWNVIEKTAVKNMTGGS
jgi:hypothetical protein